MATVLYVLHVLGAVVWVGGMVFAIAVLRPAAQAVGGEAERLVLMNGVLQRFFRLLWHIIPVVLVTGWAMWWGWYYGFTASIWHVHAMHLLGLIMAAVFVAVVFGPWRQFRSALAAGDQKRAVAVLETVRKAVSFNLLLGLLTVTIAAWGRFGG